MSNFPNGGATPVHIVNSRNADANSTFILFYLAFSWTFWNQANSKYWLHKKSCKLYFKNLTKRFLQQINQAKRGKASCSVTWCNMIACGICYNTVDKLTLILCILSLHHCRSLYCRSLYCNNEILWTINYCTAILLSRILQTQSVSRKHDHRQ